MYFNGDIIITDPCYVVKQRYDYWNDPTYPKWNDCMVEPNGTPIANLGTYVDLATSDEDKDFRIKWVESLRTILDKREKMWEKAHPEKMQDDWESCNYGEAMDCLGFTTYLTNSTECGDWSCTTFEEDTNKELGKFCADSGMVGIFLLEEVLKYNPEFDYHVKRPFTTTLIKDFDGDVNLSCIRSTCMDNGDEYETEEIEVVGKGNVNFYTTQTGF